MKPLRKRLQGRGWHPAKRARDLKAGDVVLTAHKGSAVVNDVSLGLKVAHFHLEGKDRPYTVNVWRRLASLVAVEGDRLGL